MSYGQWKIDEDMTFKEFNYYSNQLSLNSHKPVKCVCEACGQIANKRYRESNRKHVCKSIIDGKKKCFKCKIFKSVEDFSKNRSTFDGYQKVCKKCFANYDSVKKGYKKKSENRKNNLNTYLNYKTTNLKTKCKQKNLDFDLNNNFLYELYLKQNGKCYYTDIDIVHNLGCHQYNSISVDRLDPNKGYTKDNVVLASFSINSFKGMINVSEYKDFLNIIIPKLIDFKNK